jgi:ATP-binding cassette, subfamily D (ALD), peroxisomal long-chain fatty acid import protein
MLRIGTQSEKDSVEKELLELRERLANVDGLKRRRDEIDAELNKVWVENPGQPSELSPAAPDNGSPTG